MKKPDNEDDPQFANQGWEMKMSELDAGYCPTEEENNVEAKLPDPPSGGTGEQGEAKDLKEE